MKKVIKCYMKTGWGFFILFYSLLLSCNENRHFQAFLCSGSLAHQIFPLGRFMS